MQNARIVLFFSIATILGTLAHECGHYIAALSVGFSPKLHYAYTTYNSGLLNRTAIETNTLPAYHRLHLLATLGGPAQTVITGILGIIALMIISGRKVIDAYNAKHLFWITVAYCWSRELVVASGILFTRAFYGYYPMRSDEYRLFMSHPAMLLPAVIVLFLLSGLTLTWITFRLVKHHRLQLVIFGALGCIVAWPFWMKWIGPLLLPYP